MSESKHFLSARLKQLRNGRPQAEIARLCGITQQNYNRYERGTVHPKHDALIKLATHYGLTVEQLIAETDPSETESIAHIREKRPQLYNARIVEPEIPQSVEALRIYMQAEVARLNNRVEMLEEAFKLIPKRRG